MPAHQRLGTDDGYLPEDRRKPTIELNEEQTIAPVKLDAAFYLTPKDDELLPERGILGLKPDLGLEKCGQQVQGYEEERDHRRQREAIRLPVQSGSGFRHTDRKSHV